MTTKATKKVIIPQYVSATVDEELDASKAVALKDDANIVYGAQDRDISTLLAMDTYQGMTDTEVQKVLDYKERLAHMDEQANAYRVTAQENMDRLDTACTDMVESAQAVLQKVLEGTTHYEEPSLQNVTY